MNWQAFFLNPAVVWVLIPVSAILIAGINEFYRRYCDHQERIAMIENGIHPDSESRAANDDDANVPAAGHGLNPQQAR